MNTKEIIATAIKYFPENFHGDPNNISKFEWYKNLRNLCDKYEKNNFEWIKFISEIRENSINPIEDFSQLSSLDRCYRCIVYLHNISTETLWHKLVIHISILYPVFSIYHSTSFIDSKGIINVSEPDFKISDSDNEVILEYDYIRKYVKTNFKNFKEFDSNLFKMRVNNLTKIDGTGRYLSLFEVLFTDHFL